YIWVYRESLYMCVCVYMYMYICICIYMYIIFSSVIKHIWCEDFLVRSFYLKNLQTNETRTVTQFHFLSWHDQKVPASTRSLLDFRRYNTKHNNLFNTNLGICLYRKHFLLSSTSILERSPSINNSIPSF
uniref:Tyrosine-protein phosphatase domain-containing protein n=1 Tax=Gopherus evgoodei TaxID=1825980 RepID=A0A8C4WMG9_9SAUR